MCIFRPLSTGVEQLVPEHICVSEFEGGRGGSGEPTWPATPGGGLMSAGFQIGSGREQARHSRRDEFLTGLDWTIDRAVRSLLDLQHPEGYWNAALEAPAQMNAEFIIFNHFMDSIDCELEARIAKYLLQTQQPDGSWNLFPGGEGYPSYTIEAYTALKLAGMSADDDPLVRARQWIM